MELLEVFRRFVLLLMEFELINVYHRRIINFDIAILNKNIFLFISLSFLFKDLVHLFNHLFFGVLGHWLLLFHLIFHHFHIVLSIEHKLVDLLLLFLQSKEHISKHFLFCWIILTLRLCRQRLCSMLGHWAHILLSGKHFLLDIAHSSLNQV